MSNVRGNVSKIAKIALLTVPAAMIISIVSNQGSIEVKAMKKVLGFFGVSNSGRSSSNLTSTGSASAPNLASGNKNPFARIQGGYGTHGLLGERQPLLDLGEGSGVASTLSKSTPNLSGIDSSNKSKIKMPKIKMPKLVFGSGSKKNKGEQQRLQSGASSYGGTGDGTDSQRMPLLNNDGESEA